MACCPPDSAGVLQHDGHPHHHSSDEDGSETHLQLEAVEPPKHWHHLPPVHLSSVCPVCVCPSHCYTQLRVPWPWTRRTDGDGLGSPTWAPPNHHSTSTGPGGPTATQVRLKGTLGKTDTSCGSWMKWGTPAEQEEWRSDKDTGPVPVLCSRSHLPLWSRLN